MILPDWISTEALDTFNRWVGQIITFKHLTKQEVMWYCNELSRRFKLPRDTLVKLFKREGLL